MKQKLFDSIVSAISNLEAARRVLMKRDEAKLHSYIWRAAADSEYALFLISIIHQDEPSSWKLGINLGKEEAEHGIMLALDLIKEVRKSIEVDNNNETYKKLWIARGHLLNVQEIFERRERK